MKLRQRYNCVTRYCRDTDRERWNTHCSHSDGLVEHAQSDESDGPMVFLICESTPHLIAPDFGMPMNLQSHAHG